VGPAFRGATISVVNFAVHGVITALIVADEIERAVTAFGAPRMAWILLGRRADELRRCASAAKGTNALFVLLWRNGGLRGAFRRGLHAGWGLTLRA
jgi:hypothetical protein